MRVSGLDDKEIDNYFSDMMTEKEMRPYIKGAEQQGYRKGFKAGVEQGTAEGVEKGIEKGIEKVAKSMLSLGIPVEQIGIATGLSPERIETLRQDLEAVFEDFSHQRTFQTTQNRFYAIIPVLVPWVIRIRLCLCGNWPTKT